MSTARAIDYAPPAPRLRGPMLVLSQTWALAIDSFRQLQSRKLFWITLILSTLVAASFGAVGINANGLKILWFDEIFGAVFNTNLMSPAAFYKLLFLTLGISIWLAWAAIILALVSTAGMIPELVGDGSVDLYLSKPLGRVRLLLTKYVLGLMFVALQTICFTTAAFLVLGIRGGVWEPGLFWTVPFVTVLYSYLFSIAALVGLISGSTVPAILVTLLIWLLVIFGMDQADQVLLTAIHEDQVRIESAQASILHNERLMARFESLAAEKREENQGYITARNGIESAKQEVAAAEASLASLRRAHWWVLMVKAPLPKTSETLSVLNRKLLSSADLDAWYDELTQMQADQAAEMARRRDRDEELARQQKKQEFQGAIRAEDHYLSRSAWWSIGTSLGFEAIMLAIACWIFIRRDF